MRLGINIDHVATIRNARGGFHPDPVKAAEIANEGITLEYDSGDSRTTLEVIQSRSLLLDARISNAKAERDFAISKFELLAVIGKLTLQNLKKL